MNIILFFLSCIICACPLHVLSIISICQIRRDGGSTKHTELSWPRKAEFFQILSGQWKLSYPTEYLRQQIFLLTLLQPWLLDTTMCQQLVDLIRKPSKFLLLFLFLYWFHSGVISQQWFSVHPLLVWAISHGEAVVF